MCLLFGPKYPSQGDLVIIELNASLSKGDLIIIELDTFRALILAPLSNRVDLHLCLVYTFSFLVCRTMCIHELR